MSSPLSWNDDQIKAFKELHHNFEQVKISITKLLGQKGPLTGSERELDRLLSEINSIRVKYIQFSADPLLRIFVPKRVRLTTEFVSKTLRQLKDYERAMKEEIELLDWLEKESQKMTGVKDALSLSYWAVLMVETGQVFRFKDRGKQEGYLRSTVNALEPVVASGRSDSTIPNLPADVVRGITLYVLSDAYADLGLVRYLQKDRTGALEMYKRVIPLSVEFVRLRESSPILKKLWDIMIEYGLPPDSRALIGMKECEAIDAGENEDYDLVVMSLISAITRHDEKHVADLLWRGADPNTLITVDKNVLMLAVDSGSSDLVKLLLDKGANPHLKVPMNYDAVEYARLRNRHDMANLMERYSVSKGVAQSPGVAIQTEPSLGMQVICPNCGTALQYSRFCPKCGTLLDDYKPCPSCRHLVPKASRFCGFCGKPLPP